MHTKILASALAFVLSLLLSSYICLSTYAERPLNASEFRKFFSTILTATILHSDESGGTRALKLAREALTSSLSSKTVEIDGHRYSFPLPKYSVLQPDQSQYYLVFISDEEKKEYFNTELPRAGWTYYDQLGAAHFYTSDDASLLIRERYHLTTGISEFSFSVRNIKQP